MFLNFSYQFKLYRLMLLSIYLYCFTFIDKPSRKQQQGVEELTYSSIDRICSSRSTAVCVIAFLGNSNKEYIKEKEAILDRVRKSETLRVGRFKTSSVDNH